LKKVEPSSQLSRIQDSILDLYNPETLEPLQSYLFPPWDRTTPFSVNISSLSKEDEAIAYSIALLEATNTIINIYTDASSIENRKGIGVGFTVLDHSQTPAKFTFEASSNIGPDQLVYNGELEGVTRAIEYASEIAIRGTQFKIYSDNQAGLFRLRTPSDKPGQSYQIRAINAAKLVVEKGATIDLNWVPGHTDIEGNELADKLAKEGTAREPSTYESSYALLGVKIRAKARAEWRAILDKYSRRDNQSPGTYSKQFGWKIGSQIQLPGTNTKRELASSFYQLKIGYGYIKDYLYRLGHSIDNKCNCRSRETPSHLILYCNKLKPERKKLENKLKTRLSLGLLLHTTIGISLTLEFLNKTRISTRKWHLQRCQLEDSEVVEGIEAEDEEVEVEVDLGS